jgi:uncharacterized protein (DUF885 family)
MNDKRNFDAWAEEFAAGWVRAMPQVATAVQYFSGTEQDELDRTLAFANAYGAPYGKSAALARAAHARRGLEELAAFPFDKLTPQQRTSAAVIEWSLSETIANAEFAQQRFIFDQFKGLHLTLVTFLSTMHPMRNERDAENYLARLSLAAGLLDQGIVEAKNAAAAGILPPRFILERAIEQLDIMTAGSPAGNVLVAGFDGRLAEVNGLAPERRAALVASALEEVRGSVLPALGRVRALLAAQLPDAGDDAGAWRLPRGDAFYRRELAASTGSSRTPEEIHAIGLREVARIEAEMDQILKQLGHSGGTVKERVERLNESLSFAPDADHREADADPRDEILLQLEAVVKDAERRSESAFDLRPVSPVTVKREPPFSEKTAAAHYTRPAPDGSKPGIYWIPLADLGPTVPWLGIGFKATAYHEAIPGHHFQLAIQQESKELPRFRKLGAFGGQTAFIEGWALYAERLSDENGWYEGDLPARLGYLQQQLFRARRLVVDTGLHAMKWTRQQAIDFGFTAAEVERYIVWPGQACAYALGQLRFLELRERAKAALGDDFAIKEFHNVVLRGGTLPLDVLAREVDAWVETRAPGHRTSAV